MSWEPDELINSLDAAEERRQEREERMKRSEISADERERNARMSSLQMSQRRMEDQLTRATNPMHREMIERSLISLKQQMEEL